MCDRADAHVGPFRRRHQALMISTDQALGVPVVEKHQSWPSIDRYLIFEGVGKGITRASGVQDRQ